MALFNIILFIDTNLLVEKMSTQYQSRGHDFPFLTQNKNKKQIVTSERQSKRLTHINNLKKKERKQTQRRRKKRTKKKKKNGTMNERKKNEREKTCSEIGEG